MLNNDYNCGFSPSFGILNPLRLQKLLHQLCANTANSAQNLSYYKNMAKKSSTFPNYSDGHPLIIAAQISNELLRSRNRS
jgi:hypothetical protein